jgi:transcriptional regulator with XRE-family HTH domain
VRVWREKRGIKQRTLAEAARVSVSYLAEIEGRRKPGSADALQRLASVLEMPLGNLIGAGMASPGLGPVSLAEIAANRLMARAEAGTAMSSVMGATSSMAKEADAIVDEWRRLAGRRGLQHQVKAAIETLYGQLANAMAKAEAEGAVLEQGGEAAAAGEKHILARALGTTLDRLSAARDASGNESDGN